MRILWHKNFEKQYKNLLVREQQKLKERTSERDPALMVARKLACYLLDERKVRLIGVALVGCEPHQEEQAPLLKYI